MPLVPEAAALGNQQTVLVATTREPDAMGQFGIARSEDMHFLSLDVSVPLQREPGRLSNGHARPDPVRDFVATSRRELDGPKEFRQAVRQALARKPAALREAVIYVHGYNNSFADGVFRTAQMRQDLALPGVALHYSWPSAANPLNYTYDRDSVLFARDGLEEMLRNVVEAGAERVLLISHSMGGLLLMETLRQIDLVTPGWSERHDVGVVMISPDIDVGLFRAQAAALKHLPQPFAVFVSGRDRVLRLSARLNRSQARLGELRDSALIADLPVTLVDISEFSEGGGHFTLGTSPALIALLRNSDLVEQAFQRDRAGQAGLLPGTVLTVQNVTEVVLSPGLLMQE